MHKILVIEDNKEIRENLKEIFELAGYEVIVAENGLNGIQIAKNEVPDFIIMGTQGVNSMSDRLLGSTASSVVKKAPCPLFVIPEEASFQSSVMMGYASNLSNSDPTEILRATKLLNPIQPVAIHCVHFGEKQKYTKDTLEGFEAFFAKNAPYLYINFYSVKTEDKVDVLNDIIARHDINLMVMYRPFRSFWKALFRESFTQEMSKHVKVPLLILKEKNS